MRSRNRVKERNINERYMRKKKPINPKLNPDSSNSKSCKTTKSSIKANKFKHYAKNP